MGKTPQTLSELGRITSLITALNQAVEAHEGSMDDIHTLSKESSWSFVDHLGRIIANHGRILSGKPFVCESKFYYVLQAKTGIFGGIVEELKNKKMSLIGSSGLAILRRGHPHLIDGLDRDIISKGDSDGTFLLWNGEGAVIESEIPDNMPTNRFLFAVQWSAAS